MTLLTRFEPFREFSAMQDRMKKMLSHACLVLLMFTLTASLALATTYTIPAGSGTLSYTAAVTATFQCFLNIRINAN